MIRSILATVAVIGGLHSAVADETHAPRSPWMDREVLNDGWLYLERDTEQLPEDGDQAYAKVDLPHTWNALDTLETADYRRAGSWYRKNLEIAPGEKGQRVYLRFGAAGQQARVFLNGTELTHHIGGYSAFTCELTDHLKSGSNRVDVWVSNSYENHIIPLSADFTFYGGLYRSVELLKSPEVAFSRTHLGGPGVRVWSEAVSDEKSDMQVSAMVSNGADKSATVTVSAKVTDSSSSVVSQGSADVRIEPGQSATVSVPMPEIANPTLWSPEDPALYRVDVELLRSGAIVDTVSVNHGFRYYKFTADHGFFLNGQPYKLRGTNRHQDFFREGNALPLHRHLDDLKLMKEAGINWLRMAHYQQDDYLLQLCDEMGILVWEEIPYVNKTTFDQAFEDTLQSMMKDLIEQHFNHPSIILWGMGNEVWMGDRGDGYAKNYDLIKRLNALVHREDPVRKTVFVVGDRDYASTLKVTHIPDVFGYNLYRGWYGGDYTTLTARLNELHALDPERPLILSEFGAGSDLTIHSEHPVRQDFSIEYQNEFLKTHLDQTEKLDWLCGVNEWAFADFGSAARGDSIPHVNQKGLVTFDRKKKDAFFLFKSRWSKEPVVYIESPFWTEREGKREKKVQVFTNMDTVEFFLNGESLGKQTEGFRWNVSLKEGDNSFRAVGEKGGVVEAHGFKVNYDPDRPKYHVTASSEVADSKAAHTVDGDRKTCWNTLGEQSITVDLGHIRLVDGVTIAFGEGSARSYNLAIKGSVHGEEWIDIFSGSSQRSEKPEKFEFVNQQEIRYLQIDVKGNNENNENSVCEIDPQIATSKRKKNLYEKIGDPAGNKAKTQPKEQSAEE